MVHTTQGASALTFHETTFHPIPRAGQPWLTAAEIADALGYASDDAISRIYRRRAGEFTAAMSETVKLTASGNLQKEARIFSLRGAHLLGMFARTERAAEFRRWVLDILDQETERSEQPEIHAHTNKLTQKQREHISREAQKVALQQYDNTRKILTDCALDNIACGATEADAMQYVEALASYCDEMVLVNVRDLQEMVRDATNAINAAGSACAAIRRIEQRTGLELYHRPSKKDMPAGFHKHDSLVHEVVTRMVGERE